MRPVRRPERGASAVEFALVVPILLLLVFGIIQYGWYFYVAETASGAASNVARRLAVGDCWTGDEAKVMAQAQSPKVTNLIKSPTSLSGATVGTTQVTVVVTADAMLAVPFVPVPDEGIITRTVKVRLEDKTASGAC